MIQEALEGMSTWKLITVTQKLVSRYGEELRCQGKRCGRRLKVGEKAWSHRFGSSGSKKQYYCEECYNNIWI